MSQPLPPSPYPVPVRSERIADAVVHALGVTFALIGALLLLMAGWQTADGARIAALSVYAVALTATFLVSALYHLAPWDGLRPALRRLDHAAIYLKIAGTATPFAALAGGAFAWGALGLLWALALGGAAAKLVRWRDPSARSTAVYLGLGWLGVLILLPGLPLLPWGALALVLAGGLLYTLGTFFFIRESLRFATAIWHGFVLAASGCFFAAIALGTLA
ncbi:putative membrane protein, hemolysin III-like protein [Rubellimicrobium thermophilum DSM 16684]|uniref:Putative membrane protein, hemolysin III-like protein n=1 Tax=Rubellimicrobium thermophilum DSM 16684 TaxID=1123069 RepID=S9QW48_9RHOB|nr:hemolysin III family protein [Rubellimicrobium thermophilum]EPX83812.1 putative membrane protein, hemolysin III-like protein [Rubellimicrobium thermophilum DSM 16684]